MKANRKLSYGAVVAALLVGLGGCAGMSEREKGTAVGAGAQPVVELGP